MGGAVIPDSVQHPTSWLWEMRLLVGRAHMFQHMLSPAQSPGLMLDSHIVSLSQIFAAPWHGLKSVHIQYYFVSFVNNQPFGLSGVPGRE